MKKLTIMMLGMALAFGTVATTVSFAQDKKDDTKKASKKKGGKKKEDAPKKDSSR